MTWRVVAAVVALAAVVGANAFLLLRNSPRNDPVGRLSPLAHVRLEQPQRVLPSTPYVRIRGEDD